MTVQDVMTLIQTVGFPIAMCGLMSWYVKYISDKNREQITAEREAHKEEMNEVGITPARAGKRLNGSRF